MQRRAQMIIGIAYDTKDMYDTQGEIYNDFADEDSILSLKRELTKLGHKVILLGNAENIRESLKQDCLECDIVYNTVEGIASRNREGIIPSLLEAYSIPYIGTDSFGLSLTLNKYLMKIVAQYHGIKTPNSVLVRVPIVENLKIEVAKLRFPIIIKPNYEGNSSGISVCYNMVDAENQISKLAALYQTDILCEEFIFGKEITIPYIDTNPKAIWDITTVDVQKSDDFWLDVNWKTNGDYRNIILDTDDQTRAHFEYAVTTLFNVVGCRDFCRFDFRLTANNEIYFIEANPLPALFNGGSFDIVGQKNGYTYGETLELIVNSACARLSIPKI